MGLTGVVVELVYTGDEGGGTGLGMCSGLGAHIEFSGRAKCGVNSEVPQLFIL